MNPVFNAKIQRGKIVFYNPDILNGYLISLEGKDVEVVLRKHKKLRSNNQNAYYWGVALRILSEHLGYTDEEMHDALKMLFLQDRTRKIPTLKSTTELTTAQFEEYLENVRHWAATELSCFIPLPNEVDYSTNIEIDPTPKELKEHQQELELNNEKRKVAPISEETLKEIMSWADKEDMSATRIIELSLKNFNREPKDLTQTEAEQLDALIVAELI